MTEALKLLAEPVVERLSASIEQNLERYRSGNFDDLAHENGWEIASRLATWDPAIPGLLDPSGTPDAEVHNSLTVYSRMQGMTPALAREERLWARLCHVECLEFARARWIPDNEHDARQIRIHFFASGLTGCRDDNAIGRLWWNGHMASLATPDDIERGLRRILARANYRMHIIENAEVSFRQPLIAGIIRMLGSEPWLNIDDKAIVDFMREVNKYSGGLIFEALGPTGVDDHLKRCLDLAMAHHPRVAAAA